MYRSAKLAADCRTPLSAINPGRTLLPSCVAATQWQPGLRVRALKATGPRRWQRVLAGIQHVLRAQVRRTQRSGIVCSKYGALGLLGQ